MSTSPTAQITDSEYESIRTLSKGKSSFVELVRHKTTQKQYAIKRIERGRNIDKYALNEITNHQKLLHHHVIQFHRVFLTSTHLCIVMEYAAGGNMLDFVNRLGGLKEVTVKWYFQQLIVGLDYCHKMGVANRDIKLENTLLDGGKFPLLKICDFGYSKHVLNNSMPKSFVGTPAYLAPEVIACAEQGVYNAQKADTWSSGVFLFIMTYRMYPFDDVTLKSGGKFSRMNAMISMILNNDLVIPDTPVVSDGFKDLLRKILTKNLSERITIEGIKRHPWFQEDLPKGALEMNEKLMKKEGGLQSREEIERMVQEAKTSHSYPCSKTLDVDDLIRRSDIE